MAIHGETEGPEIRQAMQKIKGTAGNDSLVGGTLQEMLIGYAGDDTIVAGDGDDVVKAGPGSDRVNANSGSILSIEGK